MASYPVSEMSIKILQIAFLENPVILSFCLKISLTFTIDGEEKLRDESAAVLLLNHQVSTFTHILGELHLLHISVFVGLDVSYGDLANYEDGLSSGQALPFIYRSMVERNLN